MSYKILVLNPGSTSTKIALYEDERECFKEDINPKGLDYGSDDGEGNLKILHDSVIDAVKTRGFEMSDIDAIAARGGAMAASASGVYAVDEPILKANAGYVKGHVHACFYSPNLAHVIGKEYGIPVYILNAQSVDELMITARFTGFPEVFRYSGIHALNHKEVGQKAAKEIGKPYDHANLIVAHLGGGITIAAHKQGRMVDYSGPSGEGPMAPTRSGTVPCMNVIEMSFSGKFSEQEIKAKVNMLGGLTGHTGTGDAREVEKRIHDGDVYAGYVYDSMIYQIAKNIGAMSVTLEGSVDAIALTGGMANSDYIVNEIKNQVKWIAPVLVYPGEFEMEALGMGVLRVLRGEEKLQEYTGKPIFDQEAVMKKRKVY